MSTDANEAGEDGAEAEWQALVDAEIERRENDFAAAREAGDDYQP